MKLLLIICCILFDLMYLLCKKYERNKLGVLFKSLASLCFISIAYLALKDRHNMFNIFIFVGLIFDGFGDFFLALKNVQKKGPWFMVGAVSFMIGHLFYIIALVNVNTNKRLLFFVVSLIVGAIAFKIISSQCVFKQIYYYPGFAYFLFIFVMLGQAILLYINNSTTNNLYFMIGAIMFVCSDILLVIYNFSKKEEWLHPTYSFLYYIGQLFIANSL